jgi:EAL and modified HD-GYP domain-containing signal transduction protein
MSTGEAIAGSESPTSEPHSSERSASEPPLVSREPVLDARLRVRGYRIHYANSEHLLRDDAYAHRLFEDVMSVVGLEELVGSSVAYLPVSAQLLSTLGMPPVRPDRMVLRIAYETTSRPGIRGMLDALAARGYSLSLYELPGPVWDTALMNVFGTVEVDCSRWPMAQAAATVPSILDGRATPVATRLRSHQDFEQARSAGFELFAGPFFTSPPATPVRKVPVGQLGALSSISRLVGAPDAPDELEQVIEHDPGLSVKLLRYINSAYFGMAGQIASIRQAVALLGARGVTRWAMLVLLTGAPDAPRELSVIALTRARMCELLGGGRADVRAEQLFTVGLLSVADALLQTPLETLVAQLPLADEVAAALVHRRGPAGAILEAVLSYERGEIGPAATEHGDASLARVYLTALAWAEETLTTLA